VSRSDSPPVGSPFAQVFPDEGGLHSASS
jgi:hypothetical protein